MAKLKAAHDPKREAAGKCEGRKSYAKSNPEMVATARGLRKQRPRLSLRQISAQLAFAGLPDTAGAFIFGVGGGIYA